MNELKKLKEEIEEAYNGLIKVSKLLIKLYNEINNMENKK